MNKPEILNIVSQTRNAFEDGSIDSSLLKARFGIWYPGVANIQEYIDGARDDFPNGCCSMASAYLREEIGAGQIKYGRYNGYGHTVLKLSKFEIVDITADQFGGPDVYYGSLEHPWTNF